jgi:uncharacterized membrane protein YoaK (UPF0700 family)
MANVLSAADEAKAALIRAAKTPSAALGMVVHKSTEKFIFLHKTLIFSYSLSHLALLSFTFGFVDSNSFYRFQLYDSMQTGNMIRVANYISTPTPTYDNTVLILKTLLVMTSNIVGGTFISCFLLEACGTREKALACIVTVCLFHLSS